MTSDNEEQPNESPLARDEVTFSSLATTIGDLAEQLQSVARRAEAKSLKRDLTAVKRQSIDDDEVFKDLDARITDTFIRALNGLRQFRRNYDHWERTITEHVLANRGVSQREAARHLGVAASTINRWAQHPLKANGDEPDQ